MQFRTVPAGSFMMGSDEAEAGRDPDEGPRHRVTFDEPFYLGIYEVTQVQYQAVMGEHQSRTAGETLPVDRVNWQEASAFCQKLSADDEQWNYRLPTEAEWEYACRAGTDSVYYWGDVFDEAYAWSNRNSKMTSHPVGSLKPNAWGFYDMSGNVWEWCATRYGEKYSTTEGPKQAGATQAMELYVYRGGGWPNDPILHRSAERNYHSSQTRYGDLGFRVVAESVKAESERTQ